MVNKVRKGDEALTAYRRWKWREFAKPVAEFGDCVACAPALSVGKNKLDVRWKEGICLDIKAGSGESLIGASEGVAKARDFRRKAKKGGHRNKEDFDKFRGVPWEPYPGA
jgi:hypothetical protein